MEAAELAALVEVVVAAIVCEAREAEYTVGTVRVHE